MNFSELKHSRSGRIKQIFIMSGPYTFSMLIVGVMEAINTYFAGKIGTIEIQATALAMALLNSVGFVIHVGMTYGYEVLGP